MKVLAPRTGLSRFSPRHLALAAVAVGLLGGVALGAVPARAQETTAQLLQRMGRLERDLNTLQRQVYRGEAGPVTATDSSGQSFQPSAAGGVQPLPGDVAGRLQVRIGELERLVQDLTGRVEEAQFQTRRVSQRLDQLISDIDFRLGRIEQASGLSTSAAPLDGAAGQSLSAGGTAQNGGMGGGGDAVTSADRQRTPLIGSDMMEAAPGASAGDGQAASAPSGDGAMAPEGGRTGVLGYMRSDGRALPAPAGSAGPSGESAAPPSSGGGGGAAAAVDGTLPDGTPEEQYRYAFSLLRKGEFAAAERALKAFLEKHPDDALAGNAQYWLGESYYVRGDMQQAMVAFMDGYKTYPKSGKGPDNLLKLGMAAGATGQTKEACAALERLGQEYPQASDAIKRRAAAERQKLACGD